MVDPILLADVPSPRPDMMEHVLQQFLFYADDPSPANAFLLGAVCSYAGDDRRMARRFRRSVDYDAPLVLDLLARDCADDLSLDEVEKLLELRIELRR
jgi:hypothetical protein